MSYYDDIYEAAVDAHYLITTTEAAGLGVPGIELVKLARRGRLEALGNGVYRLARYVPSEADSYALAVARVGVGAYLWGESVIALLGLAPTNPDRIFVATPRRVRRRLPKEVVIVRAPDRETDDIRGRALPTRVSGHTGLQRFGHDRVPAAGGSTCEGRGICHRSRGG